MSDISCKRNFLIYFFLGILIFTVALTGVLSRGNLKSKEVTSVRGEVYEMVVNGVYKYNSQRMTAEGIGWDMFTLFIVLPVFFIVLIFLYRCSIRAQFLMVGILVYFFYQYFMYAIAWAFGPLFIPYIIIFSISLYTAIFNAVSIDLNRVSSLLSGHFPKKSIIILCVSVALLLLFMWVIRIIAGLRGDLEKAMLLGQTTMVVQALDLGLLVPLAIITAWLVYKDAPAGFILSPILIIKAAAMAGAICFMVVAAWIVEGKQQLPPLIIFATIFFISVYLGIKILKPLK